MKRWGVVVATLGLCLFGAAQPAHAALFVTITQGGSSTSCDTGVGGCAAGWTIIGTNNLLFTGTVGGYSIGAMDISANVPGDSTIAESLDTKNRVTNVSASGSLVIDTVAYDFTLPAGPNLLLSGAQTANWAVAAAGDSQAWTASASITNSKTYPGGVLAPSPTLVNPTGDTTTAFSSDSGNVPFTRTGSPFSLLGREVITQAVGSTGAFTATIDATPVGGSTVPEPASLLLVGTGLLGLLRRRARNT